MLKASTRAICISPFVARQRHRNYHRYLRMYWLFRGSRKIWHFCHGLLASPDVFACLFRGSFHCSRFSSEIGWLSSVIGGLTTGVAGCSRTKGGKTRIAVMSLSAGQELWWNCWKAKLDLTERGRQWIDRQTRTFKRNYSISWLILLTGTRRPRLTLHVKIGNEDRANLLTLPGSGSEETTWAIKRSGSSIIRVSLSERSAIRVFFYPGGARLCNARLPLIKIFFIN